MGKKRMFLIALSLALLATALLISGVSAQEPIIGIGDFFTALVNFGTMDGLSNIAGPGPMIPGGTLVTVAYTYGGSAYVVWGSTGGYVPIASLTNPSAFSCSTPLLYMGGGGYGGGYGGYNVRPFFERWEDWGAQQ